jgi:ATP-dependent DNA helicase PIF1
MMGQEVFRLVDKRLREARPHCCDQPFGGVSIVLLGDWKQLPPVADSSLYNSRVKNPAGYNLYQLFTDTIIFEKVQRQDGDEQKPFREELQRLGDGKFSFEDWNKWKSRGLYHLDAAERQVFLDKAILACAHKKDMVQRNIEKVKDTKQPIAPIFASSTPAQAKADSSDRACGLVSKIILSKNSIFRLTSNLWTAAGLTNGAVGTVQYILYEGNAKPPALPDAIIATFDSYIGPPYLPDLPNSVPICPVRRDWFSNKIHCSRTMLPVILGYALTIHKLQGSTCDKIILNPGEKEFATGLLLVGATRTRSFRDLAFADPFPHFSRFEQVNKSSSLKLRREEEGRLERLQQVTIQSTRTSCRDVTRNTTACRKTLHFAKYQFLIFCAT